MDLDSTNLRIFQSGRIDMSMPKNQPGDAIPVPTSLTIGQILEGAILQVRPHVLVETAGQLLRFEPRKDWPLTIGQRLSMKVIDPNAQPPLLELSAKSGLPGQSLLGQSTYLLSQLYRSQPLESLRQWIGLHVGQTGQDLAIPLTLHNQLLQRWNLAADSRGDDIYRTLLGSGLFSEFRAQKQPRDAVQNPSFDLKIWLQRLQQIPGMEQAALTLIDGITATQLKSLDAAIDGELWYHWLLLWQGDPIQINLQQTEDQRAERQWRLSLEHHGAVLGKLTVELLLTEQPQGATANIHFRSDQIWLLDLIATSESHLGNALDMAQIGLQKLTASSWENTVLPSFCDYSSEHAIVDLRI